MYCCVCAYHDVEFTQRSQAAQVVAAGFQFIEVDKVDSEVELLQELAVSGGAGTHNRVHVHTGQYCGLALIVTGSVTHCRPSILVTLFSARLRYSKSFMCSKFSEASGASHDESTSFMHRKGRCP